MGNYCEGTARLIGDKDTLNLIHVLCQRLDECASISGFDGDEDWLPHIFTEEVSEDGIFYEGGGFDKQDLELYIRASRTTGDEFFADMAQGLGITVKWVYTNEYDNKEYSREYTPRGTPIRPWVLRTEESLDKAAEEEEGRWASRAPTQRTGISPMSFPSSGSTQFSFPSIQDAPDPSKLTEPGWFRSLSGDVCFNVGSYMVVVKEAPLNSPVTVQLLAPDHLDSLWTVVQERQASSQLGLVGITTQMIRSARAHG